jgi:hypothetical protein
MRKQRGCGRELSRHNLRYEGLRTTTQTSVRTVSVAAEIQTLHLPNTSQKLESRFLISSLVMRSFSCWSILVCLVKRNNLILKNNALSNFTVHTLSHTFHGRMKHSEASNLERISQTQIPHLELLNTACGLLGFPIPSCKHSVPGNRKL